jgi:PKD repeat protein
MSGLMLGFLSALLAIPANGLAAVGIQVSPTDPEIGDTVTLTITGVADVSSAEWDFGDSGCGSYNAAYTCTPFPGISDCLHTTFQFASGGQKTVNLTVNGGSFPTSTLVNVQKTDSCPGGSGHDGRATSCSYALTPTSRTIPNTGGSNFTITVNTTAGCNWTANRSDSWINIQAGSAGSGPGTVTYEVPPNTAVSERTGAIIVQGQYHAVSQNAASVPTEFSYPQDSIDIGEEATFRVSDDRLIPVRWEFGDFDCEGATQTLDCTYTPDYCRSVTWSYRDPGWKAVRLTTTTGTKEHGVHVRNSGECCLKDAAPDAGFTVGPNPVMAGEEVTFTADTVAKSLGEKTQAVAIQVSPSNPEIGDTVTLTITGISDISSAEWNFGESGCGSYNATYNCTPFPGISDCLQTTFQYSSGGQKTVNLTVNGGSNPTSTVVNVQSTGTCPGGGGGGCSYALSPTSRTFDHQAGSGTFTVNTGAECEWAPQTSAGWINIVSGGGPGSGTVSYQVAENTGPFRQSTITVNGKSHSVRQDAVPDEPEPQDSSPDSWLWTVSLDGQPIVTSTLAEFTHTFEDAGLYTVRLEVENCMGTDVEQTTLQVDEPPVVIPTSFVVPSAVHTPGLNETLWRSDLRIFNPDVSTVTVDVEFQPENTDNVASVNHGIRISIPPNGTRSFGDILSAIPGIIIDDDGTGSYLGSLSIQYENGGESEVPPLIMSRTYNITETGTFGQFVPAISASLDEPRTMHLTGLVHNLSYRTNVRLANLGDTQATATLRLYDKFGVVVGDPVYINVKARSTTQVNGIADSAGVPYTLDIFSVTVDSNDPSVVAWASLVDNITGDPVLYSPIMEDDDSTVQWIPGVAHLPGANESQWRSDMSFYNSTADTLTAYVEYIPSEDLGLVPYMEIRNLASGQALYYEDILGISMLPGGVDSKGFIVVEAAQGDPLPQISARTYNLATEGGTFGQNLKVFRPGDLITAERRAFIPGVVMTPSSTEGFRTNLGILNPSTTAGAQVLVTLWAEDGSGSLAEATIYVSPYRLWQADLANRLGLADVEARGTLELQLLSGEGVLAYESVVDNQTQDPILVPAVLELKRD